MTVIRGPLLSCLAVAVAALLPLIALHRTAHAEASNDTSLAALADYSLEDLMQVEVYSASKQVETVFTAASAIYVITGEDIHKSGVTSLPEALRLAPGVQVSKIDGNKWAVSIRGFAGRFANKLLVLQDGRTIYNPLFSGVYWNAQEIMLEDIEQIEVIRGPAATLWGVNAVNGVINIITKHAKDTQGGVLTASGGTSERGASGVRYGGKIGDAGYLRVYGKYFYRDVQVPVDSPAVTDALWNDWRGGFRSDWALSSKNSITFQGDLYESRVANALYGGSNLLGRWNSTLSDTSTLSLQLYYDRTSVKHKEHPELRDYEIRDTADVELQQTFALGNRQHVVWGTGFRVTSDQMNRDAAVSPTYVPTSRTDGLFTLFLHDKVTLLPERLHLIVGSRAEHNDMTGWEIQPTARLLWTPHEKHTLWSAVSRAVRTPSRAETTISARVADPDPAINQPEVRLVGNSTLPSEKMIAYEAGYRYQPMPTLSFDLALFYNDYSSLVGVVQGNPSGGSPPTLVPVNVAPTATAIGKGGELSVNWKALTWMDLALAYSYLDISVSSSSSLLSPDGSDFNRIVLSGETSPRHQMSLISFLTLPHNVKCTFWLRYVDSLPALGVPDYVTLDTRIAWKPVANLEFSLVGQNLLAPKHQEFGADMFGNSAGQTERSMYGKVAWLF